jgi:manganese/iron transport system substrate-binding protein
MNKLARKFQYTLIVIPLVFSACSQQSAPDENGRIQLMATTSVVGDIVRQVGGASVEVEILLPLGTDPHSFTPTPNDISRLAEAKLVFINGAGLEEFLTPMIESAGVDVRLIDLSATLPLRSIEGEDIAGGHGDDPHTWMDPNNVIVWTQAVAEALGQADPAHQADYQVNADLLQAELVELDRWVREQVEQIPVGGRQLVTDHLVFGYFADRYGFQQVGAIIPGFSTLSEPSAQELAQLEDAIVRLNVPALFVGRAANQNLAERIAEDTGVRVIQLYTHSLSPAGGEAEHYQDFIRYNVNAIVAGLR